MRKASAASDEAVLRSPPVAAASPSGARTPAARAFGIEKEDLDAGLWDNLRPVVVTRLLASCTRPAAGQWSEAALWSRSLAWRTHALLAIGIATGGARRDTTVRCPAPECGQMMEVDLDLEEFCQPCEEGTFQFSPVEGTEYTVRLPSGADQLLYGKAAEADPLPLARALVDGGESVPFQAEWLPALESALEQHDPLTTLQLQTTCPWCGKPSQVEFDLEDFLLRDLCRRQRAVLDAVHRIALAYHWSEQEILALSAGRRAYYLDRIDREGLS